MFGMLAFPCSDSNAEFSCYIIEYDIIVDIIASRIISIRALFALFEHFTQCASLLGMLTSPRTRSNAEFSCYIIEYEIIVDIIASRTIPIRALFALFEHFTQCASLLGMLTSPRTRSNAEFSCYIIEHDIIVDSIASRTIPIRAFLRPRHHPAADACVCAPQETRSRRSSSSSATCWY